MKIKYNGTYLSKTSQNLCKVALSRCLLFLSNNSTVTSHFFTLGSRVKSFSCKYTSQPVVLAYEYTCVSVSIFQMWNASFRPTESLTFSKIFEEKSKTLLTKKHNPIYEVYKCTFNLQHGLKNQRRICSYTMGSSHGLMDKTLDSGFESRNSHWWCQEGHQTIKILLS